MKLSPRKISLAATLLSIVAVIVAGTIYEHRQQYFPYLEMQAAPSLRVRFIQYPISNGKQCEVRAKRMADAIQASCPSCNLLESRCLDDLNPRQRKILYGQPVDVPTMRIPEGAIAFTASTPELALQACLESAAQTTRLVPGRRDCSPPSFETLQLSISSAVDKPRASHEVDTSTWISMALIAAAVAFFICLVIVRSAKLHAWFTHDETDGGPQKFHAIPVARIGGVALAGALGATLLFISNTEWLRTTAIDGLFMLSLASIPAFAGGFAEDITKRIGVIARLMLTISAGVIASLLVGATLDRLDVPGFDTLLHWPIFAIAFTAFAVGGVANAINIIDGYHGLVGGYAVIVLMAFIYVASQVGDPVVLSSSLVMLGALLGFLAWNYPNGRIFLGDGGAYLLGFWLAELAVLLVARNPEVSPWFPLLVLAYPVFETFVSIYRKVLVRGYSPGYPDGLHLHMLIYKRLARIKVGSKDIEALTRRNSAVAPYVWTSTSLFIGASLTCWSNTFMLLTLFVIFCFSYLCLYSRLLRWRAPRWLINSMAN